MEQWKDIIGYNGTYQVSNFGRVRKLHIVGSNINSRILKQSKSSTGYLHVQLYKNGNSCTKMIHILVATSFLLNPDNKPQVNHKDGNKLNNSVKNLEWVTKSENIKHAYKLGLLRSPMLGRRGSSPQAKEIYQCDEKGNIIQKWDSIAEASRALNCQRSCILRCLSGSRKTFRKYIWKYVN